MIKSFLNLFIICYSLISYSQIPTYYNNVDFNKSGNPLKSQLSNLITNTHTTLLPYTSSSFDTWALIKLADLEYTQDRNVLLIYGYNNTDGISKTDRTRDVTFSCHTSSCIGLWNREHVFAQSIANPSLDTSYPSAGTDVHNLRAIDSQMNSSRSNRLFASGSGTSAITLQGNFYPGDEWKGDVARIIMYMYLRYQNQCLPNNMASSQNTFSSDIPDILLSWNVEDPISEFETNRNDIIASYQGNRNPFIDNPYLATLIWGGTSAQDTWSVLNIDDNINTANEEIIIYPNPTMDILFIKSNSDTKNEVIIYSIEGKEVLRNKDTKKINVSSLKKGLYIIKVINDKKIYSNKILLH